MGCGDAEPWNARAGLTSDCFLMSHLLWFLRMDLGRKLCLGDLLAERWVHRRLGDMERLQFGEYWVWRSGVFIRAWS